MKYRLLLILLTIGIAIVACRTDTGVMSNGDAADVQTVTVPVVRPISAVHPNNGNLVPISDTTADLQTIDPSAFPTGALASVLQPPSVYQLARIPTYSVDGIKVVSAFGGSGAQWVLLTNNSTTSPVALNLAGGSGVITGLLPLTNFTNGTAAQVLVTNAGATTSAWVSLSQDVTITAAGVATVNSINGSTPVIVTPATLEFASTTVSPTFTQASTAIATQGANLTITPQQSTQASNNGGGNAVIALQTPLGGGTEAYLTTTRGGSVTSWLGPLVGSPSFGALYLGSATPTASNEAIYSNDTSTVLNAATTLSLVAGSTVAQATTTTFTILKPSGGLSGTNAFSWESQSVALTSGTGNVLTASQYYAPHLKFTGTLTGAGTTVTFPSVDGACWDCDFSAIVTIADSIALIANGNTWSVAVASVATEYPHVCYTAGSGRLVGSSMVQ